MTNIKKLKELYSKNSKHSNYQILSKRLTSLIDPNDFEIKTRFETERLDYIIKNIDIKEKLVLDVGGNTGFFSFEMLDLGALAVRYFEGNKAHTDFVALASKVLNVEEKIEIFNKYITFDDELKSNTYDVVLLLNVLHHLGDDYGNNEISIEQAKNLIVKQLNSLSGKTSTLVFQLGFNWKGNPKLPLFKKGTKDEMINYITKGIAENWVIQKIGIAEKISEKIKYLDLNKKNIERFNELGEFLNRPIFILKKKG